MRSVFADTLYWGASLNPHDQYAEIAAQVRASLGVVHLVTTDEVLLELLNLLSQEGRALRQAGTNAVLEILNAPDVTVHSQSHQSFLAGLDLYRRRSDKGYSLTDCISMATMRRFRISEVLTADHHFAQEGFTLLFP
jgi:uncharacterized protein